MLKLVYILHLILERDDQGEVSSRNRDVKKSKTSPE